MTTRDLDKIFNPDSVAVIGATDRKGALGRGLTANLIKTYEGEAYPVNPNRDKVFGIRTFSSVKEIPNSVALAVIATPAPTVPQIIRECGEVSIPASIIVSAGFRESSPQGEKLEEKIGKIREEYGMRILGPNSLGVMRPSRNLNATISDKISSPGGIAFISQSGALGPSILDWQAGYEIGFSSFVSVGNMLDVDFGDLIDYFGKDPETRTILMHVESIRNPKKFMSAAKGFAKTKPIILEKPGKYPESSKAISSHIGSLPGDDSLYESLFRRSGVVRVEEISDLFSCSEALAYKCLPRGPNLAIITNAGGPGAMATDALLNHEGKLASLSNRTIKKLEKDLAPYTSKSNPIDVSSDANVEDYLNCIGTCLKDEGVDGILIIYAPQGESYPNQLAKALVKISEKSEKPILTCWMGREKVQESRNVLRNGGIPTLNTPEQGVRIFMYMYEYLRNKELLYETPKPLSADNIPLKHQDSQRKYLKTITKRLISENRSVLTEDESKRFLQTYNIPTIGTYVAHTPEKAADLAEKIGFPVALKIRSPNIDRESSTGIAASNLESKTEVKEAFKKIVSRAESQYPEAKVRKVIVRKGIRDVHYELSLGSKKDPRFGSVIFFGRGGIDEKLYHNVTVDFPPLNEVHARRLVERTKVPELLEELDDEPSVRLRSLLEYLARFSQLVIDFPEIKEMELDLAGTKRGLFTVDAQITLDKEGFSVEADPHAHLIIEPYPLKYIQKKKLKDGREVTIRPIKPEDEVSVLKFFDTFSEETRRRRFFVPMKEVTHEDMIRFTNIDYWREMAIVGALEEEEKIIGLGELITEPGEDSGEIAVVMGDPWQGLGLGTKLVESLIEIGKDKHLKKIWGSLQKDNFRMLHICEKLGFQVEAEYPDMIKVVLTVR
ncbi:hypothetical protein AKJ48_00845 [candidate division MSBL1 archaeon SCGC-AAA261O19]|uniref:acetate--CoA ligase (ADP-forming) n=1 Tax=candidate division MSBL1 archaeon SCGC-AAA261O19 TaxID=1698277 RepID=A0A133VEV6_9EURY|nr:hypothetical protein AKJ48_00845 [candidate division MSBL1 archaeon SCGC-AAA261O19]